LISWKNPTNLIPMENELKEHILLVGSKFCSTSRLAQATVWAKAARDARFPDRIESGKTFTIRTYDTVMRWFSDHWPEGVEWPADIPRPQVHAEPVQ